jgi:putrescine aminotransferase
MHAQERPAPISTSTSSSRTFYEMGRQSETPWFGLRAAGWLEDKSALVRTRVAAFIAEPVQGCRRRDHSTDSYWPEISALLTNYGILLIRRRGDLRFRHTWNTGLRLRKNSAIGPIW